MSLLSGRKAYLPLEENHAYKVTLLGWTERELEKPTDSGITGFLTFKWQVADDNRVVTDNRSFPVGTDILASQLINQLPNNAQLNAMEQEDLFQMMLDTHTVVDMWVERKVKDDDSFTNYHFREFKSKPVTAQPSTPAPANNGADNFK